MKVIVAGSRSILDHELVVEAIESAPFYPEMILTGGAHGVDAIAEEYAHLRGIRLQVFQAEWWKHGQKAGPLRNREMARQGDALVLVWDGHSHGSRSMRVEAQRAGLPIHEVVVQPDGQAGLCAFEK